MKSFPQHPIRLSISSCPAHLPVVRSALERVCELMGFASEAIGGVVLSVDEALTNIIRHAYQNAQDRPIEITLLAFDSPSPGGLRIELRDFGRSVPREAIRSRSLDDVRPGGLGVHIMNECMDSVEYVPGEGGGTVLTMIKNLTLEQEASK